jgi:translation elongation factor EF-1alpha
MKSTIKILSLEQKIIFLYNKMDASTILRNKMIKLVYVDYLAQKTQFDGGCLDVIAVSGGSGGSMRGAQNIIAGTVGCLLTDTDCKTEVVTTSAC